MIIPQTIGLAINPLQSGYYRFISPTYVSPSLPATLYYDDGQVGPYSPQGKDTLYGYFDVLVQQSDAAPWGNNPLAINFQLTVFATCIHSDNSQTTPEGQTNINWQGGGGSGQSILRRVTVGYIVNTVSW
jgi:hypothetical protein